MGKDLESYITKMQPEVVDSYLWVDLEPYVIESASYKYFIFIMMAIGEHIKSEYLDDDRMDNEKNTFELRPTSTKLLVAQIKNNWAQKCADHNTLPDVLRRLKTDRYAAIKDSCTLSHELVLCIIEKQMYANMVGVFLW